MQWKTMFQSKLIKMLSKGSKILGAMLSVKRGRPAVNEIIRLITVLGRRTNLGLVKVIITYLASLNRLQKRNGLTFMVKTMKVWSTLLMQSLGGQRLYTTNPLGLRVARTKAGLPRIIPALHRTRMRNGDIWTVRLWQSLFGLYRVIEIPGKLKISTITSPGSMKPWVLSEFSQFVIGHLRHALLSNFRKGSLIVQAFGPKGPLWFLRTLKARTFLISKSGPAARRDALESNLRQYSPLNTSPAGIWAAAHLWKESKLMPLLEAWCQMTGNIWVLNRIDTWTKKDTGVGIGYNFVPEWQKSQKTPMSVTLRVGGLGRLGTSDEAAGKVRVFAMVDCFTQWLFEPLHKALFELLKSIPTDGTFDQMAPIERLLKRRPQGPFYSFDLSAATDRLPLSLQKALLAPVLTSWGAEVWGTLLVGRPYDILHKDAASTLPDEGRGDLRSVYYEVGQPMGALSSWAMLAFTHHAIVQWAALRAGNITLGDGKWFLDYALLGDDIVVANHKVAMEYKRLMEAIGVEIGDHKSLVSTSSSRSALEFAKKFFLNGKDASMAPFAEYWAAKGNLPASLELAKKYGLNLSQYLTVMGYGYRAKAGVTGLLVKAPTRIRNYVVAYYSPAGPGFKSLLTFFTLKRVFDVYVWTESKIQSLVQSFYQQEIKKLLKMIDDLEPLVTAVKKLVTVHRDIYHYQNKKGQKRPQGRTVELNDLWYDPEWNVSGHVIDSIVETVYREAFLDVLSDIRTLRNRLEEVEINHLDWVEFEGLLNEVTRVTDELSLVPLPRELYARSAGKPAFKYEISWTELYSRYSSHFRSTRSTSRQLPQGSVSKEKGPQDPGGSFPRGS